ncbi:MAG: lysophospholipid acyltransferase family protein [Ktedonobacterales bacterium]
MATTLTTPTPTKTPTGPRAPALDARRLDSLLASWRMQADDRLIALYPHFYAHSLHIAGVLMDGVSVGIRHLPQRWRYRLADALTTPLVWLWRMNGRLAPITRNYATLLHAVAGHEWTGDPVASLPASETAATHKDAQLDDQARDLAGASVRNYGRMAVDFLAARTMRTDEIMAWAHPQGDGHFADVMREGHGVIMAAPHVGSWDVAAVFAQAYGCKLTVVTEQNWVTELVAGGRRSLGITLAPRDAGPQALRALFAALRRNECVVLLSDIANEGVQTMDAPFFGRPSPFPMGPARLAVRTGAPILVVGSVRLPDGSYLVEAQPPLRADPVLPRDAAVAQLTEAVAAGFERIIAAYPDQWYPFHPIWP